MPIIPVRLRKKIIQGGAVAAALIAISSAWHLIGAPIPALSSDIQRLDLKQSTYAVELYNQKLRSYLTSQPPNDPAARQLWEEDARQARQQRDDAEKRRIELSK